MTEEQFEKAKKLNDKIADSIDGYETLGRTINYFKREEDKYNKEFIFLKENSCSGAILPPLNAVEFINFLEEQKTKTINRIDELKKEFEAL